MRRQLSEALSVIDELKSVIKDLRTEIDLLKNGHKSDTSSTPSSQDYGRSNKFNSRQSSGRKSGGQPGHKGSTLKMSEKPDEIVEHIPRYCKYCGEEFNSETIFRLYEKKQEIVIPPIKPKTIEHQSFGCTCGKCGAQTISDLPPHLKANVQYGKNIQSLVTYLSVYQYLPSNRIKNFLKDIMGLSLSEGTIYNIIKSMSTKAIPAYEAIKKKVAVSKVVGGDETGIRVNGDKAWFWVFQNNLYTYIKAAYSRSYQSIVETFANGFPMSVYVTDSLAAQLKTKTLAKQLCLAHLMRELKNFEQVFKSEWATMLKQVFKEAVEYKKQMTEDDYGGANPKVKEFENRLSELLEIDYSNEHRKLRAFIKRLIKNRGSLLTFLYHFEVPPDNNGSERAIRNAKVKMKISNQFKTIDFANHYAVIRSVIDTSLKNSQNVFDTLTCLANQELVAAE